MKLVSTLAHNNENERPQLNLGGNVLKGVPSFTGKKSVFTSPMPVSALIDKQQATAAGEAAREYDQYNVHWR